MNEEEKQAIKKFENLLIKHFEDKKIDKVDYMDYFEGATILNLIEKQQKEIEELEEDNNTLEMMINTANEREYRKKYIEERRKEQPNLYCPDFDEVYERYYKQKAEIEQMEENYISKDKIKELREIDNIDLIQFKLKELLGE